MKPHLTDSDIFFAGFKAILLVLIVGFVVIFVGLAIGHDITWKIPDGNNDYDRGYMDGFRDGQNLQYNYGTAKIEGGEE